MKPITPPDHAAVPQKFQRHLKALLHLRDVLSHACAERDAELHASRERGGTDPLDVATAEATRGTILAEISLEQAELSEVDAALGRLRRGTFGRCEVTGQPIEPARLRALPWTRFCQSAAARLEKVRPKPGRPA